MCDPANINMVTRLVGNEPTSCVQAASRIVDGSGVLQEHLKKGNSVFVCLFFFTFMSPYTCRNSHQTQLICIKMDNLQFLYINLELVLKLNFSLTTQEINLALQSMQINKALGPVGFSVEFFKAFQATLVSILPALHLESLSLGSHPPTLRQASVSVLLKKDKDPDICSFYRPDLGL